jgi:dienelactone hydrolase
MNSDVLRQQISEFLNFSVSDEPVPFTTHEVVEGAGYTRSRIRYAGAEVDEIPAFLLMPEGEGVKTAVLVHHQHNSQRHLGKSEVCGLAGDPWQAFAPALARMGIAVLAPDSICFEDRRHNCTGIEPDENDVAQHFNEMCYRLLRGDTLMHKVLDDSARAISLLQQHPRIDASHIGIMGHSYGGNTVLFHGALDTRIQFMCASGAACSYQYKMNHQLGIEMALAIPGFAAQFDIQDLVRCMAPRQTLLVSATEDKHAMDAAVIVAEAREAFVALATAAHLAHKRYVGGHPLTAERFDYILQWLVACCES